MMALGDDSGVFIEELDYFPGVHSRRWIGEEADDNFRNIKILQMMNQVENRKTYLISRFVLVDVDGRILHSTKTKNVFNLSHSSRGEYGFGYDKILKYEHESFDMRKDFKSYANGMDYLKNFKQNNGYYPTIAELPQNIKNDLNQRGCIANEIYQCLKNNNHENI